MLNAGYWVCYKNKVGVGVFDPESVPLSTHVCSLHCQRVL